MAAFPNPFRALGLGLSARPAARLPQAGVNSRYLSDPGVGGGGGGGGRSPIMWNWRPVLREAQADTQEAWMRATAQVIDALHTSGWLHGGIISARGQIIGEQGLRLNLKPWGGVISSDPKIQAAWARDVEGRFHVWAANPWQVDWGGRYGLGQLMGQAVGQYFATGEIVGTLPYDGTREGTSHGTKLNLMPSSRLSQANGPTPNTVQGVTLNTITGAPIGYNFHRQNYATGVIDQQYVRARDENGRPLVIHLLDNAPSAVRGITPLAPALRIVRQFDQLQDGTHVAQLLQTVFAATVKSDSPTEEMMRALQGLDEQEENDDTWAGDRARAAASESEGVPFGSMKDLLTARAQWYKNTNIDLGRFGKIAHLFPGEELKFNKVEAGNNYYKESATFLLQEIARCLGITTYQLTGDFNGFTYTTAKMAVDEAWPLTLWRRAHGPARLGQMLFEAWLEEDILLGYTTLPGGIQQFYAQRDLICRGDWRGPPRPTADDLKTAKANQVLRAEGWASTESIAASYGEDWVELADSQSESDAYREAKKLPPLPSLGGGGNGAGSAAVAGAGGRKPLSGTRSDPDSQSETAIDQEARLVGAMMRGDNAAVDAILTE